MSVDAVLFDWGGTLTPWHTFDLAGPWRACAELLDGLDGPALDDAVVRLCSAEAALWRRARETGQGGTVDELFELAGLVSVPAAMAAYHKAFEPHTYTDPDAAPLLRALRERRIRVGILSNTLWERAHHEDIFTRDGVLDLLDGAAYSSEIGWAKPDPQAFRAAMAAVGVVDPARVVFVGDRLFDDVQGAAAVGMRTILVPHSDLPPDQVVHTDITPDGVVRRLSDVLSLVDGWR